MGGVCHPGEKSGADAGYFRIYPQAGSPQHKHRHMPNMRNELSSKNKNSKTDAVEIRFPLPLEEYQAIKVLCDTSRIDVAEVARNELGRVLENCLQDRYLMASVLEDCQEQRNAGLSRGFRGWRERHATVKTESLLCIKGNS